MMVGEFFGELFGEREYEGGRRWLCLQACKEFAPAKRNQERVKSILLLAIPDEYLLKFHNVPDAKSLWAAIKSRFGGNDESKKMQRNVLKHQFENFTTAPNESLDKAYDSQIALIIRNKPDIDQTDIDDLYNNLRVYEDEMKRSSSSTSNSQNLAFLSSENTSSTNEVSTTSGNFRVNTAGGTSSTIAMMTVRVQRFIQKTRRNLDFKGIQPVTFDKSKVECYNCHRKGHFAKECKSGRNQGKRSYSENGRRNTTTNEPSSQALVAQDGLGGYDWSNDFDEPVNYALMAISSSSSSSSSDNEVQNCSKQCLESFKILQKNFDSEREKHSRARLEIQGYELALESLESRILGHEKNELAWGEKYEFQNYELKCRELKINNLNMELEKVVKERDELNIKIAKWEESSKSLNKISTSMSALTKWLGLCTQLDEMSNRSKSDSEAVSSSYYRRFLTPRADISFAGLDEYAIRKKIIESKTTEPKDDTSESKTSETVGKTNEVEKSKPKINRDKVIIEDWNSDDEDDVSEVNTVSPVKTNETQTVKTQVDKIGQISQKEGIGFKKIKACFVCKSTDHLIKDCDFYAKKSPEPKLKTMSILVKGWSNQYGIMLKGRAVVDTGKGKMDNALRKSRWVWRPKGNYMDHESKENGSFMLKKFEYVDPKGNSKSMDHAVVDSGYSSHMTGNKAYLSDYEDYNGGFVAFGNELKFNLFSVLQMCDKKNSVLFTDTECLILSPSFKLLDESQVVLRAPRKDDVYSLDLKNIVPSGGITCLYANATSDESKLWHRRLGHMNFKNIYKLVKGHLVRGLPSKVFVNDYTCVACKKGKQHKASCKAKLERTIRKPLELLHMDLFGPVSVESINKKKYCLVVTDDFSRFSWVFFLATKDETTEILCKFIIGLENQLNHKVKIIRCDHETEFKNYAMNEFCAKKGIKREFSMARTP
ncbi:putative ribonuclease H-like domain-containing protein [Tanacetum coccineum]